MLILKAVTFPKTLTLPMMNSKGRDTNSNRGSKDSSFKLGLRREGDEIKVKHFKLIIPTSPTTHPDSQHWKEVLFGLPWLILRSLEDTI